MRLSYTEVKNAVKRPVVAIVLSLLPCVFGVVSFDKIETSSNLKESK
ncbi:hypothetical protein [Psychromonas ingrahamii]|nr:hypothetical protein [Psychromonas ingrahamii]